MVWLKCMVLMRWMSQFTDLNRLTLRILPSVCIYAGIFESLYISNMLTGIICLMVKLL